MHFLSTISQSKPGTQSHSVFTGNAVIKLFRVSLVKIKTKKKPKQPIKYKPENLAERKMLSICTIPEIPIASHIRNYETKQN